MSSALICVGLVSCSKNASDDYHFEQKEYTLLEQKFEFVVVDNITECLLLQYVGADGGESVQN